MISRARPLLGTVVTIQIGDLCMDADQAESALEQAFSIMAHIARVMSAHDPSSDLGRMSRVAGPTRLRVDPHTVRVLQAAQYWCRISSGAFDPVLAAHDLRRRGRRPGLLSGSHTGRLLSEVSILGDREIALGVGLCVDVGGIAKGYAVDQAIEALLGSGVISARINAGGDMRAVGQMPWPVVIRHAGQTVRGSRLMRFKPLVNQALATSVAGPLNAEFVQTRRLFPPTWRSATVQAPDCMTADVLTKWALQSSVLCPGLTAVLARHQARMWRT